MTGTDISVVHRSRAWVEIDLPALQANARALAARLAPHRSLMAVVKADAYGHGLLPVAHAALHAGARWLGVATVGEGLALRRNGISAPIALLCSPPPADAPYIIAHGLTPMLGDLELAALLATAHGSQRVEVHLDIDTGMGRSGVLPENAVALWRRCTRDGLTVTGICTHFADADGPYADMTLLQWKRFAATRRALECAGARFDWIHAGNSAAVMRYSVHACNLVRPGLLLYGLRPALARTEGSGEPRVQAPAVSVETPSVQTFEYENAPLSRRAERGRARTVGRESGGDGAFSEQDGREAPPYPPGRPVLALKARVGAVRDLPAGHTVSYGATCRLSRFSRLATVLIGYGDGYPRRLSNCGMVLLRGCRARILGRVCMDQTVVDVTDIPDVAAGDIATCIGTDGAETITAEAIACLIQTTEHEITTCLTSRLPREYREES